ncbi:MAG: universal stress protein [Alcanivorax sp.]|nr:universal stress protein [Alcanivorax sp.]
MTTRPANIVVACDGSPQSLEAAQLAVALARDGELPLTFLTVFPRARSEILAIRGTPTSDQEENQAQYRRKVFESTRQVTGTESDAVEEVLLAGDPAEEIIAYMDTHPGTQLVLGRRGHSLMRSLTLGSVSEKVIRHAHGPVTVVSDC